MPFVRVLCSTSVASVAQSATGSLAWTPQGYAKDKRTGATDHGHLRPRDLVRATVNLTAIMDDTDAERRCDLKRAEDHSKAWEQQPGKIGPLWSGNECAESSGDSDPQTSEPELRCKAGSDR
ncbi:hypothetical protein EYF80_011190 [Liparis tanakae]|uniref:Uncharacterized protein n=1 Tax=Liparis tanakae TaxID=230148 RepID=A0A4Z2IL81_9TELE|nr:hypothetical protein EYF80_011190 [Liparis tanakae]